MATETTKPRTYKRLKDEILLDDYLLALQNNDKFNESFGNADLSSKDIAQIRRNINIMIKQLNDNPESFKYGINNTGNEGFYNNININNIDELGNFLTDRDSALWRYAIGHALKLLNLLQAYSAPTPEDSRIKYSPKAIGEALEKLIYGNGAKDESLFIVQDDISEDGKSRPNYKRTDLIKNSLEYIAEHWDEIINSSEEEKNKGIESILSLNDIWGDNEITDNELLLLSKVLGANLKTALDTNITTQSDTKPAVTPSVETPTAAAEPAVAPLDTTDYNTAKLAYYNKNYSTTAKQVRSINLSNLGRITFGSNARDIIKRIVNDLKNILRVQKALNSVMIFQKGSGEVLGTLGMRITGGTKPSANMLINTILETILHSKNLGSYLQPTDERGVYYIMGTRTKDNLAWLWDTNKRQVRQERITNIPYWRTKIDEEFDKEWNKKKGQVLSNKSGGILKFTDGGTWRPKLKGLGVNPQDINTWNDAYDYNFNDYSNFANPNLALVELLNNLELLGTKLKFNTYNESGYNAWNNAFNTLFPELNNKVFGYEEKLADLFGVATYNRKQFLDKLKKLYSTATNGLKYNDSSGWSYTAQTDNVPTETLENNPLSTTTTSPTTVLPTTVLPDTYTKAQIENMKKKLKELGYTIDDIKKEHPDLVDKTEDEIYKFFLNGDLEIPLKKPSFWNKLESKLSPAMLDLVPEVLNTAALFAARKASKAEEDELNKVAPPRLLANDWQSPIRGDFRAYMEGLRSLGNITNQARQIALSQSDQLVALATMLNGLKTGVDEFNKGLLEDNKVIRQSEELAINNLNKSKESSRETANKNELLRYAQADKVATNKATRLLTDFESLQSWLNTANLQYLNYSNKLDTLKEHLNEFEELRRTQIGAEILSNALARYNLEFEDWKKKDPTKNTGVAQFEASEEGKRAKSWIDEAQRRKIQLTLLGYAKRYGLLYTPPSKYAKFMSDESSWLNMDYNTNYNISTGRRGLKLIPRKR